MQRGGALFFGGRAGSRAWGQVTDGQRLSHRSLLARRLVLRGACTGLRLLLSTWPPFNPPSVRAGSVPSTGEPHPAIASAVTESTPAAGAPASRASCV